MRRTTLLWMVLAALCGATLFHTSQQVTDGRTRLALLEEDTRKESETLRVLQAEWSYLNQPDRLEKLSRQYLDLAPLKGNQFTKIDAVADRPVPEAAPAAALVPAPAVAVAPAPAAAKPVTGPAAPKAPQKTAVQAPAKPAKPVIKIRTAAKPAPAPKHPMTAAHSPNTFNLQLPRGDSGDDLPAATAPAYGYHVPPQNAEQHRDFNDLVHSLGVE